MWLISLLINRPVLCADLESRRSAERVTSMGVVQYFWGEQRITRFFAKYCKRQFLICVFGVILILFKTSGCLYTRFWVDMHSVRSNQPKLTPNQPKLTPNQHQPAVLFSHNKSAPATSDSTANRGMDEVASCEKKSYIVVPLTLRLGDGKRVVASRYALAVPLISGW